MFTIEEVAKGQGVIEVFENLNKTQAIEKVKEIRARRHIPTLKPGQFVNGSVAAEILAPAN